MPSQSHQPFVAALLLTSLVTASSAFGIDHPAELLPPSTVIYAEVSDPPGLLDFVMEHPVTAHLQALKAYQQALEGSQYQQLLVARSYIEAQIGMSWQEAFRAVTQKGAVVAFDAETQGVALLVQAADEAKLGEITETFLRIVREDADRKGNDDPFEERDYRGVTVYRTTQGAFGTYQDWLVVVNKPELGRHILDALLDSGENSLADQEGFQRAKEQAGGDPLAWVYANVGVVREAGAAPKVFTGKADDPIGELLLGGVLEVLQHTPFVSAMLNGDDRQVSLRIAMPHQRSWISEEREHYFGPEGTGRAPATYDVANRLFTLAAHRDVSEMWLRSGDLFNEKVNDKFAEADSNLSTLFAGKDFGEDILGVLSPQMQIVAVRQEFPADRPVPAIKLPAFALIAEMQNPEVTSREFRRTFQSLIGFLNIVGAMNGQPQLEMDFETLGSGEMISSTFIPERDGDQDGLTRIHHNFSPSIALIDDRLIISSTAGLARDLAESEAVVSRTGGEVVNLSAGLSAGVLQTILADNLAHLVSQNMLEKGHTHEEAEVEVKTFLDILALFGDVALTLSTDDSSLDFNLNIQLAE